MALEASSIKQRLDAHIDSVNQIEASIDRISKCVAELHTGHTSCIEGIVKGWTGTTGEGEEKISNSQLFSNSLNLVSVPFTQSMVHMNAARSLVSSVRFTCEKLKERVAVWDKAVDQKVHYEEKLKSVSSSSKNLDWKARNDFKLMSATSAVANAEAQMNKLKEYMSVGVRVEYEKILREYTNFLATLTGGIFMDIEGISGKEKYDLVKSLS